MWQISDSIPKPTSLSLDAHLAYFNEQRHIQDRSGRLKHPILHHVQPKDLTLNLSSPIHSPN